MKDNYHLTREESVFLAKKQGVASVYSGMRMENRNVTFPQTQTVLNGINVSDVALDDIQAILNMRDAWKYLLEHLDETLTINYLCKLQERVAYREALAWGELRTGSIGISGVTYLPPIPDATTASRELSELLTAKISSSTEIALELFAWLARAQLFWDGNKRTALLAANKILIEAGAGILLVHDKAMLEFSTLLSGYYESGNPTQLKEFLYEYCILGIDESMPKKPPSSSLHNVQKRTASWLKHARITKGVTQRTLAKAIGVSTSTIANIEQEQRQGSDETWVKIEHYFNMR